MSVGAPLSTHELKQIASNEIRYRGFYANSATQIREEYKVWELTREEASEIRRLINTAKISLDGEVFNG